MDLPRKHQVSLRGASAREITRDALLEKVSQERELRSYARRASAAAVFVQRVWRRYYVTRKVASQLQEQWEDEVNRRCGSISAAWISSRLLIPFLFFIQCLSIRHKRIRPREASCMHICFKILLESIDSTDPGTNFCFLGIGKLEERQSWFYQMQKLVGVCSFIIATCDSASESKDVLPLCSLGMRLMVALTDVKAWKFVSKDTQSDVNEAVRNVVWLMGNKSELYPSARRYIMSLDVTHAAPAINMIQTNDRFLITASAVTLLVRPFHQISHNTDDVCRQYIVCLLTIPWLVQRLPAVLIPALKHKCVLSPCFQMLLISRGEILNQMTAINDSGFLGTHQAVPSVGWALANIICLMTWNASGSSDYKLFSQDISHALYMNGLIILAENLVDTVEHTESAWKEIQECTSNDGSSKPSVSPDSGGKQCQVSEKSYIDLLWPVCHQLHVTELLSKAETDASIQGAVAITPESVDGSTKFDLLQVFHFYSYMLRIYSSINPAVGSLPVLNVLSFTPGFLPRLWTLLRSKILQINTPIAGKLHQCSSSDGSVEAKQVNPKVADRKWTNVLHIFAGKSQGDSDPYHARFSNSQADSSSPEEELSDVWDVECLKCGPQGLSKYVASVLHLFCATYAHLLLVLDDIEFYEKQVPFTLEEQRNIASALNTLVYNGYLQNNTVHNKPFLESATRCLHLLYERDCRHQFCPPDLWLSPGKKGRPPVATAARTHDAFFTKLDDLSRISSMGPVITSMPHVYPFEERVEMFREFIKMDKVARVMTGEVVGPGSRNVEIVIRRGHIIEDGFRQLNLLGPRLKSSIHVSFVSECGLQEAGLDYGGLSKEFLTDLSKSAFSPEHGLFTQTSTEDRLLIPNISAKYLENGLEMIEFLGRIVGKALYEGILLDYSFSHVFVQKLLGRYSFLDELSTLDPEVYRNLMYIKHYDGDVKDLSLDFTITEESFGKHHIIDLKPGGKDINVTNENKMQYIYAIADYKLNRQMMPFASAFFRGLTDLISASWLKLFNANEFNQLLSGGDHDIDVDDLRKNTCYTGGYSERSRSVKIFWEVMRGFEAKERCMLLKFVTSCSRAPLLGFKHLQPAFTIHKVSCDVPVWAAIGGQDVERLPSASTCYNTLKLPTYKRASTMRAKLLYAISSNAGFELS
ncbi:hypothetical protein MLD38_019588 [Melastoma candidum]|uniref:Uncharacterized protein n=1 Tax=Melastoma candidum TaxID=119954 RepID=A0ACB9QWK8_9MYRT|nr:hypothetical protein MLD38_019588 [Melastoma candidum]